MLKGIILGVVIVLPGMSGGTAFIILGLYGKIIKDLSRFNLRPYWPLLCGTAGGILIGGFFISLLLTSCRDLTSVFLMGLLLASIKTIFKERPRPSAGRMLTLAAGFLLAFLLADEPLGLVAEDSAVHWGVLVFGGALSSATMLIPGIPGSSVLILLGIYDDVLLYLREFAFVNLFAFGLGGLLGIFMLAKVLDRLYSRYQLICLPV
jgi:putative membrane protein